MRKSRSVMSVLVVVWLLVSGPTLAGERPVTISTPPPYVSGGIGDDDPLAEMTGDFNLQLVFATQGSGEYLADIRVRISDAKGNPLLEAESPGPFFYVRLPAGAYRIRAEFEGKPLERPVVVSDRRLRNLYFYWPRE
jgi:hypothetical protein